MTASWRSFPLLLCAGFVAIVAPNVLRAQQILGTVVRADSISPASRAIVLLVHATRETVLARTMTDERGAFVLHPPAATPVRLRVLRLGYRPTDLGPYTIALGSTARLQIVLKDERITLAIVDVRATNRCVIRPNSGLLVAQLFEEARKALLVTATVDEATQYETQYATYSRFEDRHGGLLVPATSQYVSGSTTRPFTSLSADSLARVGYVTEEVDSTVYRAPDVETLLSNSFTALHCIELVQGTGARAALIGVGFRPASRRTNIVDIRGTLWLDRATSELRSVEYTYDPLPDAFARVGVGGEVHFTQMGNGLWFVNRWVIRMPRTIVRRASASPTLRSDFSASSVMVDGLLVNGGEVESIRTSDDVLYSSRLDDLLQLRKTPLATSVLDTRYAQSLCVGGPVGLEGMAQGRVLSTTLLGVADAAVSAQWKESFRRNGEFAWTWQLRGSYTRSMENGLYVLCQLPVGLPVFLTAKKNALMSRSTTVRVTYAALVAAMDLVLRPDRGR